MIQKILHRKSFPHYHCPCHRKYRKVMVKGSSSLFALFPPPFFWPCYVLNLGVIYTFLFREVNVLMRSSLGLCCWFLWRERSSYLCGLFRLVRSLRSFLYNAINFRRVSSNHTSSFFFDKWQGNAMVWKN